MLEEYCKGKNGIGTIIFSAKSRKSDEAMLLTELAKSFPNRVILVGDGENAVLEGLAARVKAGADSEASTLLVFAGLQRLGNLRVEFQNLFSRMTLPKGSAPAASLGDSLKLILEDGSRFGIHTLVVTDSLAALDRQVPNRFNLRVGFRLTDNESHLVIGSKVAEDVDDGFALLVDKGESSEPQEFRPYVQIDPLWFSEQLSTLKARFAP
ncbi:hypothetical protein [Oleiharenicola sp. Vm1]|uniref:hypothetical protein n=1 Tax=Oleiharenicola sp. Vm1 TaxID=3398393 RepID=UPI0039F474DA